MIPRVLCVDDEPEILEGLRDILRRRFTVVTATSGRDALALVEEHEPFVAIVSDLTMPGMDGAHLLEAVRRVSPDTVRLLLTGTADLGIAIDAVNRGQIFRFLVKPCPLDQLVAALDAAVDQHRLVTAERVLLEETLAGSVQALVDVLGLASPKAFGRASRLKAYVRELGAERGHREPVGARAGGDAVAGRLRHAARRHGRALRRRRASSATPSRRSSTGSRPRPPGSCATSRGSTACT